MGSNRLAVALPEAAAFFTCSQAAPRKASALSRLCTHQRNDSQYDPHGQRVLMINAGEWQMRSAPLCEVSFDPWSHSNQHW